MKRTKLFFMAIAMMAGFSLSAQVAINTDGSNPNSSAMLDVKSTDKGFLPPRMTSAQRDAISAPADGLIIFNTNSGYLNYYVGGHWYEISRTIVQYSVTNPGTGKTWMDRNLGASQVATSSTDAASYGDLYQWGRGADGHQSRTSGTTTTLSSTDNPGYSNFITTNSSPFDWRSPQNDNLWQGVSGINNPCPSGYRLPTSSDLDNERVTWNSNNASGAYSSPLKLSEAGFRDVVDGSLVDAGTHGRYWSSTVDGTNSKFLYFNGSNAVIQNGNRGYGYSVRCIKD